MGRRSRDGGLSTGRPTGAHPSGRVGTPTSAWQHGIAGPLALLSTAMTCGVTVRGQADAISRICAWLDRWRRGADDRPWWPAMVSLTEWRTGTVRPSRPGRPSWCYGTPGLARAQHLAALALADTGRQRQAERALAGCITDQRQLAQLQDMSLCHGWAGLALTTWRTAVDSDNAELAAHLPHLLDSMQAYLDRHGPPPHDGFLDGRAGLSLTDLAISGVTPVSGWDACLLTIGTG